METMTEITLQDDDTLGTYEQAERALRDFLQSFREGDTATGQLVITLEKKETK